MLNLADIASDWTLFLDRDGVINQRPVNDYVKTVPEFRFIDGVVESLAGLSRLFRHILVVTNQQGIGKGLMNSADLDMIHAYMLEEIHKGGGRINRIYYCPDLKTSPDNCRKPGQQMALQAKRDFPEIDFRKSIMVGDTNSDLLFGHGAGMFTVYVGQETPTEAYDLRCENLTAFAQAIKDHLIPNNTHK